MNSGKLSAYWAKGLQHWFGLKLKHIAMFRIVFHIQPVRHNFTVEAIIGLTNSNAHVWFRMLRAQVMLLDSILLGSFRNFMQTFLNIAPRSRILFAGAAFSWEFICHDAYILKHVALFKSNHLLNQTPSPLHYLSVQLNVTTKIRQPGTCWSWLYQNKLG